MTEAESCRAVLFRGVGEPLDLVRVRMPMAGPGEAIVRVACTTICGSDLHTFRGDRSGPMPCILGHEIVGTITALGSPAPRAVSGATLSIGQKVVWSVVVSCRECRHCSRGFPQKCVELQKYGHERFDEGSAPNGGLSEYCVLADGTAIVPVPKDLPDCVSAPASCATATVMAAARPTSPLDSKRVLITGAGALGLTMSAVAATGNADEIVVCDPDATRLNHAREFGATQTIRNVADATAGGFDCVFEMSGHPLAVETAVGAAGIGGQVVLVGSVSPSPAVPFDPESLVRRLVSIRGVHNYRPDDLVAAVDFLAGHHHRYPFAKMIGATFDLDDIATAFEHAAAHRPLRVAVIP